MGDLGTQPADDYASASRIILDLRGICFVIDRDTLMSLPESILLCLFPNGLMLPDPADESTEGGEEGQVVYVDVRGAGLTSASPMHSAFSLYSHSSAARKSTFTAQTRRQASIKAQA